MPDGDHLADDVANERVPAVGLGQLWRTCQDRVQALANVGDHRLDLVAAGMHQGDEQALLAGMGGLEEPTE